MEKFKRLKTHDFLVERSVDRENDEHPVCYRIFHKSVDDSEIVDGYATIRTSAVDIVHNGKVVGKELHYFLEIDKASSEGRIAVYFTDLGNVKNGLPDDDRISHLVDMGCEILHDCLQEASIPNFNHADFLKSLGFPFSIAVRVDDDGNEVENGTYCLVNSSYDVICESPVLAQARAFRDALNLYTTREVF